MNKFNIGDTVINSNCLERGSFVIDEMTTDEFGLVYVKGHDINGNERGCLLAECEC